jgi:hypothetical protein
MKQFIKPGIVLVGYIIAFVLASQAVAIRIANTSGPDADASAGMYAFGDGILFLAVFGTVALLPTGLALVFLRPYHVFWTALSIMALALAVTGLSAVSVYVAAYHGLLPGFARQSWAALAVLRMLASPLLATCFLLAGIIAPARSSRWALLVATAMESIAGIYAVCQWFLSCCFA